MIASRIAASRDSNSTRKNYVCSVGIYSIQKKAKFNQNITFGEENLIGIANIHDDALVMVGVIAYFDIKRVLVTTELHRMFSLEKHFWVWRSLLRYWKRWPPLTRFWKDNYDTRENCGAPTHFRHLSNNRGDHDKFLSCQNPNGLQYHLRLIVTKCHRCCSLNLSSGHEVFD